MDDEVLVRRIHGATDVDEQSETRRDVEAVTVAVRRDRQTIDVLHHEIGELSVGRAAVEQLCNVRMAQRGEDLPLGDEAAVQLLGVWAVTQQLDRDLATELAVVALGEIDHAHAAATELAYDAIRAYAAVEQWLDGERRCRRRQPTLENAGGQIVCGQQAIDLASELGIVCAALTQPRTALSLIEIERVLEHFLDL